MNRSSIYLKCPQCRETGLLIERQGKYFCANCMYDYTLLKDDTSKLDEVLIENMREGGFGPVFASALYERVTLDSHQESVEYTRDLAQRNGIEIYASKSAVLKSLIPIILFLVVIAVIVIVAFILIS